MRERGIVLYTAGIGSGVTGCVALAMLASQPMGIIAPVVERPFERALPTFKIHACRTEELNRVAQLADVEEYGSSKHNGERARRFHARQKKKRRKRR